MESDPLKSNPPEDRAIEAWLRTGVTLPPLSDDGFSARVISALPPPAPPARSRGWFCLIGALAGTALTLAAMAMGDAPFAVPPHFPDAVQVSWQPLAIPTAFVLAVVSLWFAFRDRLRALAAL